MKRFLLCLSLLSALLLGLSACSIDPVKASDDAAAGGPVYADIVSITSMHRISNSGQGDRYLCSCRTTDGEEIWINMTKMDILSCLDEQQAYPETDFRTIPVNKRISGVKDLLSTLKLDTKTNVSGEWYISFTLAEEMPADAPQLPEPLEYTANAADGTLVSVELISMTPKFYTDEAQHTMAVLCETSGGDTLWMTVPKGNYADYFDADTDLIDPRVFQVLFKQPVTVLCFAAPADALNNGTDSHPILEFHSVDADDLEGNIARETLYVPYSAETEIGTWVTVDILNIKPLYTMMGTSETVICRCETNDGIVWVSMATNTYKNTFDRTASINSVFGIMADTVAFCQPVELRGQLAHARDIAMNLSSAIGTDRVLNYQSADSEEIQENLYSNQPPVEFGENVPVYAPVYLDIVSIVPAAGISTETYIGSRSVVCKCITAEGKEVFVTMSTETYQNNFDPEATFVFNMMGYQTISFQDPLRITGSKREAEDICEGLSNTIQAEYVILFSKSEG